MKYDYLVVGAGLFGATFAQQAKEYDFGICNLAVNMMTVVQGITGIETHLRFHKVNIEFVVVFSEPV